MIFAAFYLFLLVMVLILSLAMPLEKGRGYFMVVTVTFSILSISAIVGIIFFFIQNSIFPVEKCFAADHNYYPCDPSLGEE